MANTVSSAAQRVGAFRTTTFHARNSCQFTEGVIGNSSVVKRGKLDAYYWVLALLTGLGLVVCCLGSGYRPFGILSLLLFLTSMLLTAYCHPAVTLKYLFFFFYACANVAGCSVVEFSNTYLVELRTNSFFAGSLPLLTLSRWAMLMIFVGYESLFVREREKVAVVRNAAKALDLLAFVAAVVLGCMFAMVAFNPSFVAGVDRFEYSATLSPILVKLKSWMDLFVVLPLMSIRENRNKFGITAVVFYVLFSVWTGAKFDAFFSLLCMVVLVNYGWIVELGIKRIRRIVTSLLLVVLVLVGVAVLLHSFTEQQSNDDYISQRLAQQGQLWWATYWKCDGNYHPGQIGDELDGLFVPTAFEENIDADYGIYHIMYFTAPRDVVNSKLSSGSRYTEAGYATAFYCLGPIGTILYSLTLGLLIAIVYNAFVDAVVLYRLVESLIWIRIALFFQVAVRMAVFSAFFTEASLVSYAVLLLLIACRKECRPRSSEREVASLFNIGSIYAIRDCGNTPYLRACPRES